jgi:hypothetical protein
MKNQKEVEAMLETLRLKLYAVHCNLQGMESLNMEKTHLLFKEARLSAQMSIVEEILLNES